MCAPIKPIGRYGEEKPTAIVDEAAEKHEPTGNRPDLRALSEVVEVGRHLRMDGELAKIRGGLNRDDPDVGAPNATAGGAIEADMMARMQVVIRQDQPPAGIVGCTFAAQDLRV